MSESPLNQRVLRDDTLLVSVGNALDNTNAPELLSVITEAQTKGFRFVILNLDGLQFLSSAGVGAIIGTVEVAREMQGDIILCHLSPGIRHVLDVLDLSDYLTIAADLQAAEILRDS
ncbi:MAG: STAS domain-containing protein [Candidatus Zixiibacteriota bacterium]